MSGFLTSYSPVPSFQERRAFFVPNRIPTKNRADVDFIPFSLKPTIATHTLWLFDFCDPKGS